MAERSAYKECIEQIVLADQKGFHTAWPVEHHLREGRSHMSCGVVLGALSQITKNIRLGFGVTLMPHEFIHPVRVAEKVATVDLLSGGRAEWGKSRAAGRWLCGWQRRGFAPSDCRRQIGVSSINPRALMRTCDGREPAIPVRK